METTNGWNGGEAMSVTMVAWIVSVLFALVAVFFGWLFGSVQTALLFWIVVLLCMERFRL